MKPNKEEYPMSKVIYDDGHREVRRVGLPTAGGAYAAYDVADMKHPFHRVEKLNFQSDTIKEIGVEGVTNETLLAIVIDRLECFQSGEFACDHNATALQNIQSALRVLEERTTDRKDRGVEGKHEA